MIRLPTDIAVIVFLRSKMREYGRRYRTYAAPEHQMGTIVKLALLRKLFESGQVNIGELYRELDELYEFNAATAKEFNDACAVIHDYCVTGGKNVIQASGVGSAPN